MKQKRILIPTDGPESWQQFLAEPDRQWQSGFSAMSTAYSWENANGIPNEILQLFTYADEPTLRDASLAIAIPEYKVALEGGSRPSQNDVFVILSCSRGLITLMVEGKAREDFDVTLGVWKKRTSPQGVKARMADISENIGLAKTIPDNIRYQLLHRTASAIIEAKRFGAPHAVMLVHSFSPSRDWLPDYEAFAKLLRADVATNKVVSAGNRGGVHLHVGWVCGNEEYLSK